MTYHRMSFIVVTIVFLLWTLINRRYAVILTIAVLLMVSFPLVVAFLPSFFADIYVTERVHGSTSSDPNGKISNATFHGRGGVWRKFMKKYEESDEFHQLFGIEMAGRAPHNDYLRVLITNGLIGLLIYLAMLLFIGLKLLRTYAMSRQHGDRFMTQFSLTALFIFIFYVLGSMTLAISLLSTITWFFWIFSGITFYQHQLRQRTKEFELDGTVIPESV
jgi:O-antigen ligase